MNGFVRGALCLGVAACLAGLDARAAIFKVDSVADAHDASPGDRRCATAARECTLRAAIEEAGAVQGSDTVLFKLSPGSTIVLDNGELEIGGDTLTIKGPGAPSLTLDGKGATRLVRILPGAKVALRDLTLRGGFVEADDLGTPRFGGAVENLGKLTLVRVVVGGSTAVDGGGGIKNEGMLSLVQCTIAGNTCSARAGAGILNAGRASLVDTVVSSNRAANFGGGILNTGTLSLVGCIVEDNEAVTGGGGIDNVGTAKLARTSVIGNVTQDHAGGLDNVGTLTLVKSTVSANRAVNGVGGIENFGTLRLVGSTVTDNSAQVAGGVYGADGELTLTDSVIAGNFGLSGALDQAADCALLPAARVEGQGSNVFGPSTGCPARPEDRLVDPVDLGLFLQRWSQSEDLPPGSMHSGARRGGAGRPVFDSVNDTNALGTSSASRVSPLTGGASYVGRVASATSATAGTGATLRTTRAVAAGDALLVSILLTSASSSTGLVSATDAAGNVYRIDRDQNDASGGDRVIVLSALNAAALASGANITFTFPRSAAYHITIDEFAGLVAVDRTASAWGTTSAFSSGSTATTTQPDELIFGVVGNESGDPPTWSSGWTGLPTLSISSDRLTAGYRLASSTGTFAASGSITGTWMAAIATYSSGPPPENPPVASLSITKAASPPLTITADGSASTDIDSTPVMDYRFDFGDGSEEVIVTSPIATALHTYDAEGTYTVTLVVIDTAGNSSSMVTTSVTVSNVPPPPDNPPTARLSVSKLSSPPLTVKADASGSTDTDATPIASYRFDFGDSTSAVTTSVPTDTAQHTYASAGTYTVKVTATDTAGKVSSAASASVTVSDSSSGQVAIYVGYYDTHHPGHLRPKPSPWKGSSGVVFVGRSDTSSGGWDSSAVRIDNLGSSSLTGVVVTVDIGSSHFGLWGTNTIPAGGTLIVAQMTKDGFDGSDTNRAGCYGCSPTLCGSAVSSTVPVVKVTFGGKTTTYRDTGQILNTHGVDYAGCPYTGSRNDESQTWQRLN